MNNTPKLRFKEFSDNLEKTTIGNEFNLSSGTTPSKSNKGYFNGKNCWITSGELKTKYINSTINKVSDEALAECNLKKYPIGTFIIAIYGLEASGTRGSCSILNTEASISQACMAFTPKSNAYNKFLYYWYMKHGEKIGITYAQGTKQQNLSTDLVSNINIFIPSKQEQLKIASFLSLIDDKISLQGEKVEALKDYKKGIMQKIFSRELRFKDDDGTDYPEWEEKKLGDITDIGTGSNDLQDKVEDGIYPFFVRSANVERINSYTFDGEAILIPGDGNIGQIYHYINGKFAYHQRVYKISDFINGVSGKYIYYYMSRFFLKEALKNSVKATVDSLRLPTLKEMDILLPCIDEQEKITQLLSNIDAKVKKEKEKLDSLNEYKKGLLQQMFI